MCFISLNNRRITGIVFTKGVWWSLMANIYDDDDDDDGDGDGDGDGDDAGWWWLIIDC